MNKIKALIIDDEPIAVKHLQSIITQNCADIEIIATGHNAEMAVEKIITLKPDLVFLDIELGDASGFDVLAKCKSFAFETIMVTAFNQFGIDAVKAHALDYILKPINKVELLLSIENAVNVIRSKHFINKHQADKKSAGRITLPTLEGLHFVDIDEIIFVESEGRYTRFHLNNKSKFLVSKNLGEYEEELDAKGFARIHHSYIVNLSYVEKYIKGRGGYVILKNGQSLEVSVRKKDDFFDKLE